MKTRINQLIDQLEPPEQEELLNYIKSNYFHNEVGRKTIAQAQEDFKQRKLASMTEEQRQCYYDGIKAQDDLRSKRQHAVEEPKKTHPDTLIVGKKYRVRQWEDMVALAFFAEEMQKYCGSMVTITNTCDWLYSAKEDGGLWAWTPEMFEPEEIE